MYMPKLSSRVFFPSNGKKFEHVLKEIKTKLSCQGKKLTQYVSSRLKKDAAGAKFLEKTIMYRTSNRDGEQRVCALAVFHKYPAKSIFYGYYLSTDDPMNADHFNLWPERQAPHDTCMEQICFCNKKVQASLSGKKDEWREVALTSRFINPASLAKILGPHAQGIEKPSTPVQDEEKLLAAIASSDCPETRKDSEKQLEKARDDAKKEGEKQWLVKLREVVTGLSADDYGELYLAYAKRLLTLPNNLNPREYQKAGRDAHLTPDVAKKIENLMFLQIVEARARKLYDPENIVYTTLFLTSPEHAHERNPNDFKWAAPIKIKGKFEDNCMGEGDSINQAKLYEMIDAFEPFNTAQDDWIRGLKELTEKGPEGDELVFEYLTVGTLAINSLLGAGMRLLRAVMKDEIFISDGVMARIVAASEAIGIEFRDFRPPTGFDLVDYEMSVEEIWESLGTEA